jgi:hypothetical protein
MKRVSVPLGGENMTIVSIESENYIFDTDYARLGTTITYKSRDSPVRENSGFGRARSRMEPRRRERQHEVEEETNIHEEEMSAGKCPCTRWRTDGNLWRHLSVSTIVRL